MTRDEATPRHLISGTAPIVEAMASLNRLSGESMTLFAVDADGRLEGSLTDGDIRRALLAGHALSDPVSRICRRDCISLKGDVGDMEAVSLARKRGIVLLPVLKEGRIESLVDLRRRRALLPIDGVIMAGGIGERMRPLTLHTPKPLLPVGGRPILRHNIDLLRSFGVEQVFVTVNYLKEKIMEEVAGVTFVEEPHKMGTIGSLSLIGGFRHDDVVVMNSDLLTDIDLEAMYRRHRDSEAWLTVAVTPYTVSVPFAIVEHSGGRVTGLSEKPTYHYYANAGIYMMRREVAAEIPKGEYMDATDLIDRLISLGRRVSLFQIEGRWLDIGTPDDYRLACESAQTSEPGRLL